MIMNGKSKLGLPEYPTAINVTCQGMVMQYVSIYQRETENCFR